MSSRVLFVLLALALAVPASACARGTGIGNVGGGGVGGGDAGGGNVGGNATTSVTTTTTTTSATTTTTTTGAGGAPCALDPCKLTLPQCGCSDGEACGVANGSIGCVPAGQVGLGQKCGVQGAVCGPGLICVQTAKAVSTCVAFCDGDTDCEAPGGLCILTLNDGNGGSIPGVTLCTENCNPANNVGCPLPGTACQLLQESAGQMRYLTRCGNAGNGTQNVPCMSSDDCVATFGCFNTAPNVNACFKWCMINGVQNCPGGTTCQPLGTPVLVGNDEYGICF